MSWLKNLWAGQVPRGGINSAALDHALRGLTPGEIYMAPPDDLKPETQAEQIANSLRDFPEDWAWHIKGYELKHVPSGFVMWVGNEDWGLAEVIDGSGRKEKFSQTEQSAIWPAVQVWLAQFKTRFSLKPAKPRVWMSGQHCFCQSEEHPWIGVGGTFEEAYRSWVRSISVQARKQIRPNEYLHVWSAEV